MLAAVMGAKYKKDDKCMTDNYAGVFHAKGAKGQRREEVLFFVEVVFWGGCGNSFHTWGKP